jgi:hypothetical protein
MGMKTCQKNPWGQVFILHIPPKPVKNEDATPRSFPDIDFSTNFFNRKIFHIHISNSNEKLRDGMVLAIPASNSLDGSIAYYGIRLTVIQPTMIFKSSPNRSRFLGSRSIKNISSQVCCDLSHGEK